MRLLEKHWLGLAGIAVSALYIYLQLIQWQKHGDDLRLTAASIVVTVGLWVILLFAIARSWRLSKSKQGASREARSSEVERKLFVCANGYPLQALQSGIALHVQVLSTVDAKIVYAKANLSSADGHRGRPSQIDLESSEPHIIPAGQMFHLALIKKEMEQEDVTRFLAPNVAIQGIIKLEENNTHREQPFQLMTHREDPQLDALRTELQNAQEAVIALSKPPNDLHVRLLCFQRATTLDLTQTPYFFKLGISCDEDSGIRDIKAKLTIGSDVFEAKPMDDLSGWIVRTPFRNKDYPFKTTEEQVMTALSLWNKLQREGLQSGLLKDGWLGIKIEKLIPQEALASRLEIQITKSKNREPFSFTFGTLQECEDIHVFDRVFREPEI